MKQLKKQPFVEIAIHTSCDAFFREDFFSYYEGGGGTGQEFYPDLSCKKSVPQWESIDDGTDSIQGRFHFLSDSASDLYLVCQDFVDKGEDYFVFFNANLENDYENGWVIWLPNAEHFN